MRSGPTLSPTRAWPRLMILTSLWVVLNHRIDDLTMKITNPNVVGSGFIAFPPQKPFEKPVFFQPPTVSVSNNKHSLQGVGSSGIATKGTCTGCLHTPPKDLQLGQGCGQLCPALLI